MKFQDKMHEITAGSIMVWLGIDLVLYLHTKNIDFCRLLRSQIYAGSATVVGGVLLWEMKDSVWSLLFLSTRLMRVSFGIAAGHWIVAAFEEIAVGVEGIEEAPRIRREIILLAYIAHHILAAAMYIYANHAKELGGLCALGLWYELPVFVVNYREILRRDNETARRVPPPGVNQINAFWNVALWAFWIGRLPATALYVISVLRPSWRHQLQDLRLKNSFLLYHLSGIAFTFFSYGWRLLLGLAKITELRRAYAYASGGWPAVDLAAELDAHRKFKANDDFSKDDDLTHISPTQIILYGKVYELAAFIDSHPGGANVLKRHCGGDATAAFEAVGRHHTTRATELLEQDPRILCLGDMKANTTKANTPRDLRWARDRAVPYSYLAGHWDAMPPVGSMAWTHLCTMFALRQLLQNNLLLTPLFFALWLVPPRDGTNVIQEAQNDDLEQQQEKTKVRPIVSSLACGAMIGAADVLFARSSQMMVLLLLPHLLALAVEALLGPPRCAKGLAWFLLLAALCYYRIHNEASQHVFSTLVLMIGISLASRFPRASREGGAVAGRTARRVGALLTSFCFDYFTARKKLSVYGQELFYIKTAALYCFAWMLWRLRDLSTLKLRRATSDSFTARTQAFAGALLFYDTWHTLIVLFGHALWLSLRLRDTLEELGPAAPAHAYGLQTAVDRIRAMLSFALRQIASIFVSLATTVSPRGSLWYLAPMPLPDIPNVEYGLALFAKGDLISGPARAITLNVGHLDVFPGVDVQYTAKATAEMLHDLAKRKTPGFVANLVCFLPDTETGRLREVNLSSWHNEKAAHDWYTGSSVHQTIVHDYYNRRMSSFSSGLASYHSKKAPRFHARCSYCYGLQTDYPNKKECPNCKRPVAMPLF